MNLKYVFSLIGGLSAVQRYSQTKLATPENVLEHTGFVAMLAYFIGLELKKNGHEVDFSYLLQKAIAHDIDEVITGDIPSPTKNGHEKVKEALYEVEYKNMGFISNELFGDNYLLNIWDDAKDGPEGSIIALCDLLSVIYKVYDEVILRGNLTIAGHANSLIETLNKKMRLIRKHYPLNEFTDGFDSIYSNARIMIDEIIERGKV